MEIIENVLKFITLLCVLKGTAVASNNDERLQSSCICPGHEVTYECTVCGEGSTVWNGSLFNCAGNEITLRHDQFESGSAAGECNSGTVVARSTRITTTASGSLCYISQLSFTANSGQQNKTVSCLHVTSRNITVIDEVMVVFETDAAPLDNVYISNISPTLELRWNQSSLYCSSAKYKITSTAVSSNGGCPNTTKLIQNGTTSASYTNEFTSGHNCNFSTETEICENITSGKSTLFLLTFRVPDPPEFVPSGNYYSPEDNLIHVAFFTSDPFNISDGVDGSATVYTITYADTISNSSCHSAAVLALDCVEGVCYDNFYIRSDSNNVCAQSANISVRVSAGNVVGNGSESSPIYIQIADTNIDSDTYIENSVIISVGVCTGVTIIIIATIVIITIVIAFLRKKATRTRAHATPDGSRYVTNRSRNLDIGEEQTLGPLYADVGPLSKETSTLHLQFQHNDSVTYAEIKQQPVVMVTDYKATVKQRYAVDEHLNLDSLLIQLHSCITPRWYEFGVVVGVSREVLDKCLGYPQEECLIEVLDHWLRTARTKPTWRDVAEGLYAIGLQNSAERILKVYKTGAPLHSTSLQSQNDGTESDSTDHDTVQHPPPIPPKNL